MSLPIPQKLDEMVFKGTFQPKPVYGSTILSPHKNPEISYIIYAIQGEQPGHVFQIVRSKAHSSQKQTQRRTEVKGCSQCLPTHQWQAQHTAIRVVPFPLYTLPKTRQELQVQPQDKLSPAAEMLLLPISQTAASYLHSLTSDTAAGGGGCSAHWMTRAISAWSPSSSCARTWAVVNPRSQVSEAKPSRGICNWGDG